MLRNQTFPNNWKACSVQEIFKPLPNLSFSRDQLTHKEQTLEYIHYGDIHTGCIDELISEDSRLPYLVKEQVVKNIDKYLLCPGDILLVDASEDYDGVTKSVEISNVGAKKIVAGLHTIPLRPLKGVLAPGFARYVFKHSIVSKTLKAIAQGTKVFSISFALIKKVILFCPPITEQQKIVEVLETWDKAIQLTRELIEQKELQKKYLMQQLLSGLLRLAKFTDSWKKEKIGNLGSTYNGIVGKTEKDFGHGTAKYIIFLNILENTAIDIELCEKVDIREEEKQNAVKCGDLFFNSSSETPEEVGMCSALLQTMDNTYLNSFCFGFRPHDIKCLSSLYLAYWFRTNQGRALMVRLAQGSTRYNLSKESFKKSQLLLPSYEEQQEIANILTLADKEIDLLRQKIAKLEEQKKGLMQVLLTGKVRL